MSSKLRSNAKWYLLLVLVIAVLAGWIVVLVKQLPHQYDTYGNGFIYEYIPNATAKQMVKLDSPKVVYATGFTSIWRKSITVPSPYRLLVSADGLEYRLVRNNETAEIRGIEPMHASERFKEVEPLIKNIGHSFKSIFAVYLVNGVFGMMIFSYCVIGPKKVTEWTRYYFNIVIISWLTAIFMICLFAIDFGAQYETKKASMGEAFIMSLCLIVVAKIILFSKFIFKSNEDPRVVVQSTGGIIIENGLQKERVCKFNPKGKSMMRKLKLWMAHNMVGRGACTAVCYDYNCTFCKLRFGNDFVSYERYIQACTNGPNSVR